MARVTAAEVEKIIEVDSDIDVDTFIGTATVIIDEYLVGVGYSDDLLKEMERYLSAHLIAMRQRQVTAEKFGDADQKYGGKFGLGLKFTQYGQQVEVFDTKKVLSDPSKPIVFQAL